jgi:hypothetical protein
VSLPFSDHCDPLIDVDTDLAALVTQTLPKERVKIGPEIYSVPAIAMHRVLEKALGRAM